MELKIYFAEIQSYVKARFGRDLTFAKVSDDAFHVAVAQKILIKTVQIGLDLQVAEVGNDTLTLAYNGGMGINMIISGLMSFVKSKLPEYVEAIELKDDRHLRIDLTKIPQAAAFVANCTLRSIHVDTDALVAEISLKA